ncbi:ankyrin repeat domain-containing protein [Methyloceanibacter superfactus]|uniref:ankyrin repeat domain-containing protein n=1 Tax=Methyloceanibacter superfactus TaxID=1774969 RepID=UPI0009F4BABC
MRGARRPRARKGGIARSARPVRANPLAHAAAAGHADLVTLFLDRGAAIDARNIDGSSALYKAAESGRLKIVELLVARGADVNLPGRSDISPLAARRSWAASPSPPS